MTDLTDFCAEPNESSRYALDKPFRQGIYEVATDGRIIVRRVVDGPPVLDGKGPPTTDLGWEPCLFHDKPEPLPEVPPMAPHPCVECGGGGTMPLTKTCDECNGEGVVECDMGHDHDCEECGAEGEIATGDSGMCPHCTGSGNVLEDKPKGLPVGGGCLQKCYVRLLLKHGVREVFMPTRSASMHPVYFKFPDGAEGLLMQFRDSYLEMQRPAVGGGAS